MDSNEIIISKYAKKIYGFAYSKTHNLHDAEDLSQNILLELCKIDFDSRQIENMDAFIYRVCEYTWSNFVRKNIFLWEGIDYCNEINAYDSKDSMEEQIIKSEMYHKLQREIMYLSKTKRDAVIMFYYEGKNGNEISRKLNIPASTVRWYLGESKKILKEHIEMKETLYTPKRLNVFFCGNCADISAIGLLRNDLLVQNICIACEKKPLTLEEIARKLCMSAAFIEDKLGVLIYMNYIEKKANKYKTTFFIKDGEFIIKKADYEIKHLPSVALAAYKAVKESIDDIRKIGFVGSDIDDNFLMWTIIENVSHSYFAKHNIRCNVQPPMHGDGSRHFIDAGISNDDVIKEYGNIDERLIDYIKYSGGAAGQHSTNDKIICREFTPAVIFDYRQVCDRQTLNGLQKIYSIIKEDITPDEYDKELMLQMAEEGYVSVLNGKPKILIPYFTTEEFKEFCAIIDDVIIPKIDAEAGTEFIYGYGDYIEGSIPDYLSKDEKEFVKTRFYNPNALAWYLVREGKLTELSDKEKKRVCRIVWEV